MGIIYTVVASTNPVANTTGLGCEAWAAIIGAIIVGVVSILVSVGNWIFSYKANNKTNERLNEISQSNIESQEKISINNIKSQKEITNKRNTLEVITNARKEWLLRLKANVAKYLGIVKKIKTQYTQDALEDTGELWYYTYLVLSDLNLFEDKYREIKEIMEALNKKIIIRNSLINRHKIEMDNPGKISYLQLIKGVKDTMSTYDISDEILDEETAEKTFYIMRDTKIMEIECCLRFLMIKFMQLYKVEWQRIKFDAEEESYIVKDLFAEYEQDTAKEFVKYCKSSKSGKDCCRSQNCKLRQYFVPIIVEDKS